MRYVLTFTRRTTGSQAAVLCVDEADLDRQRRALLSIYAPATIDDVDVDVIPVPEHLDDRDALRTLTAERPR